MRSFLAETSEVSKWVNLSVYVLQSVKILLSGPSYKVKNAAIKKAGIHDKRIPAFGFSLKFTVSYSVSPLDSFSSARVLASIRSLT